MVKIITVAQQKGGAGKTTIAAHIAVSLSQTGRRVAIIDIDPQGSLTNWHALREQKFGIGYTVLISLVALVGGSKVQLTIFEMSMIMWLLMPRHILKLSQKRQFVLPI
jgi:chromosome partitioning protein